MAQDSQTPRFRIDRHTNGQTAIFDSVGLVCTMEAGSQSKRDTDAQYIIKLETDRAALIAALDTVLLNFSADKFPLARATLAAVRS